MQHSTVRVLAAGRVRVAAPLDGRGDPAGGAAHRALSGVDEGGPRAAPVRDRSGLQGTAGRALAVAGTADRPPLLPAICRVCRARRSVFCTQADTGPLRPSETGHPVPYIDQVAL